MKKLYKKLTSLLADFYDLRAMHQIAPLLSDYSIWTASAMRPSAITVILNDIIINRRQNIVECGAGISTLLISKHLKQAGAGHLFSVEHNAEWAETVQSLLEKQGTSEFVTIVHAPLDELDDLSGTKWYNKTVLSSKMDKVQIDLLIVDGPLAYSKELELARRPAVPFFKDYFDKDFAVVLDDINRPGEQKVLEYWETDLGFTAERLMVKYGNIGLFRTNKKYNLF